MTYRKIATKLELKAQRAAKMGPHWWPWKFIRLDNGKVLCHGAVCPYRTRGLRKGEPNYRQHDKSTVRMVVV
jgi:hypothetical protein